MTVGQWMLLAAAALLALVATPVVRRYAASRGIADRPGPRRSHDAIVPRGGGLAIAVALVPCVLLGPATGTVTLGFLAGALVVACLGWLDDRKSLPTAQRLVVQSAAAAGAVLLLGPVVSISVAGTVIAGTWIWSALAIVALVWLMNLFNFMDGSDGLAATQSVLSCVLFAWIFAREGQFELAWIAAAVACAALGFLVWNWPRASIFLGDAGSLLLGWSVGMLALGGTVTGALSVWLAFILVSPFVVDATATLGWRLARGERWYTPHRDHAYQYLLRSGWSHRGVLFGWIAVNGLVVVPSAALVVWNPALDLAIAAAVGVILTGFWCLIHFAIRRRP